MTHHCQNCSDFLYCECPALDPYGCICYRRDEDGPLCLDCAVIIDERREREADQMLAAAGTHFERVSILVGEPLTDLPPSPGVRHPRPSYRTGGGGVCSEEWS